MIGRPADVASTQDSAAEALARQSVPSILAHWVIAALTLATSDAARSSPALVAVVALWFGLLGTMRLAVAKAFPRLYRARPTLWRRLFSVGMVLSSATWGVGGSALIAAGGRSVDSWIMLVTMTGICAGGLTSLSPDRGLLRLHIVCMIVPTVVAAAFLPASMGDAIRFGIAVVAFGALLWTQGDNVHAAFARSLAITRALEGQASALEAARLESLEASRVKSDFLANMSHEIRTPMAAVVGYADLLLDPTLTPGERVNHVQTIRRNGEHLMSLVNDVLDISKIEAGKMTLEAIAVSPSQVLAEVASLMRARALEKHLAFDVRYDGAVPETISSDPTRLRQILLNLVSNAIKFTDEGAIAITVRCSAGEGTESRLVIEVADTGIGMTEAQIRKVFAPFTQADASTTRRFGGSGLGLAISKHLAILLGGDITAQSATGKGTVFRVEVPTGPLAGVPMVNASGEAGPPVALDARLKTSSRRAPRLAPGCRVLLAEDGYDNQVLVKAVLGKAGASVDVVEDGQQAVEEALAATAAGAPYDVVLMDMQMPILDGYSATSTLRQNGYTGAIVALTAHAMVGDRERCESAGCDGYLSKPVDWAKLTSMMAHFAGRTDASVETLVSTLAGDEEMVDIIRDYVRELPQRSSAIMRASQASDTETLRRLAHQLRGSAGGYGFPRITEAAMVLEEGIKDGVSGVALNRRVEALAALCRNARTV
jgi:signal transduction histidine kinase/CheY-like chemotaxis protein